MIERVVSGGQTGVDRAALDAAATLGVPIGGWCPRGRKAEDGLIDPRYPLRETPSADYAQRTEWNVRDADGTLILTRDGLSGGSAQTAQDVAQHGKPCLVVDLAMPPSPSVFREWITRHHIRVLNVAGPRESKAPGIYAEAFARLRTLMNDCLSHENRV